MLTSSDRSRHQTHPSPSLCPTSQQPGFTMPSAAFQAQRERLVHVHELVTDAVARRDALLHLVVVHQLARQLHAIIS